MPERAGACSRGSPEPWPGLRRGPPGTAGIATGEGKRRATQPGLPSGLARQGDQLWSTATPNARCSTAVAIGPAGRSATGPQARHGSAYASLPSREPRRPAPAGPSPGPAAAAEPSRQADEAATAQPHTAIRRTGAAATVGPDRGAGATPEASGPDPRRRPTAAATTTFTAEDGSVTAVAPHHPGGAAAGRTARTYTVASTRSATTATAAFRHGQDIVRMTVTCEDGITVSRTQQKGAAPAVASPDACG